MFVLLAAFARRRVSRRHNSDKQSHDVYVDCNTRISQLRAAAVGFAVRRHGQGERSRDKHRASMWRCVEGGNMSASAREPGEPFSVSEKQKRPRRAFAGDVAMAELRNDLAEAPDEMSELPDPAPMPAVGRLGAKGLIKRLMIVATAA